jgi:hypothetical protein
MAVGIERPAATAVAVWVVIQVQSEQQAQQIKAAAAVHRQVLAARHKTV